MSTTKPFYVGQKVVTRDHRQGRVICTDANSVDGPIVALVDYEWTDGEVYERANNFQTNGRYIRDRYSDVDIFPAPVTTKKYRIMWEGGYVSTSRYSSYEDASEWPGATNVLEQTFNEDGNLIEVKLLPIKQG